MVEEPCVSILQAGGQAYCVSPANGMQQADIQELSRSAIWLALIKLDPAVKACYIGDQMGQIGDRAVFARTHIDVGHHG